jgi:hypothetical protein
VQNQICTDRFQHYYVLNATGDLYLISLLQKLISLAAPELKCVSIQQHISSFWQLPNQSLPFLFQASDPIMADLIIRAYYTRRRDNPSSPSRKESFFCRICENRLAEIELSMSSRHNLCDVCYSLIQQAPSHNFQHGRCCICNRQMNAIQQSPKTPSCPLKATCQLCAMILSVSPFRRERCLVCHRPFARTLISQGSTSTDFPYTCTHCLNRERLSDLELYYCYQCNWEMFPPSASSPSRLTRKCHVCEAHFVRKLAKDRRGTRRVHCQTCRLFLGNSPALQSLLLGCNVTCIDCLETQNDGHSNRQPSSPPPYSKLCATENRDLQTSSVLKYQGQESLGGLEIPYS